jgi:BirA family biotin operon repressor/biotin-[acetyl-CoA-carboxylase] ligase
MAHPFDPTSFIDQLRRRGCRFGEPLSYFSSCASTNDEAKTAMRAGAPNGATFIADEQTAGRGRRGREWFSPSGESLLFSVVVRPQLAADRLSALTLAAGLGVREALAAFVDRPLMLKWPNDVLCRDRKLAGILVECETVNVPLGVVVGVGINVGVESFPAELAELATSLQRLGATTAREALLVEVLRSMDHWIGALESGELGKLAAALRQHDALLGRRVVVEGVAGVAAGIDERGRLLLETSREVVAVHSGTVEIQ